MKTDRWELSYEKFKKLAKWYRKKYGKSPVIVFDNTNILARKAEEVLEILQLGAKGAIDEKLFVAVFVSSDGWAPNQMESKCV